MWTTDEDEQPDGHETHPDLSEDKLSIESVLPVIDREILQCALGTLAVHH